jgi:hypothetical protein
LDSCAKRSERPPEYLRDRSRSNRLVSSLVSRRGDNQQTVLLVSALRCVHRMPVCVAVSPRSRPDLAGRGPSKTTSGCMVCPAVTAPIPSSASATTPQPSWPASRVVSAAVQRVIFCYQDGELVCSLDASSGNKASTRVPGASDGEMVHFPAAPGGACLAPSRGRHRCFEPYSSYNICRVDCLLAGVTLHVELAGAIDTSPSCAGPAAALSRQRRGPQAASGTGE